MTEQSDEFAHNCACRFAALREHKCSECPECNPDDWMLSLPPEQTIGDSDA